jgi:hypothetical protein
MKSILNTASYHKDLAYMVGGVGSAIVVETIARLSAENLGMEVIIFIEPTSSDVYIQKRSWLDITALSRDELKVAFKNVMTVCTDYSDQSKVLRDKEPKFSVKGRLLNSHHLMTRMIIKRRPMYKLNKDLLDKSLEFYLNGQWINNVAPTEEVREEPRIIPSTFIIPGQPEDENVEQHN